MNEWVLDLMPWILGLVVATAIIILRPLGRRMAPMYAAPHGTVALVLTWALAGVGMWGAFAVGHRSLVLAIALILASPLAAGLAVLAYRDARRSAKGNARARTPR